ncbi:MAG: hypothetical protein KAR47_05975, partial [Planctomycetes bacterium]|nr:hypothetical protein [Planctomycetota bacterium]
ASAQTAQKIADSFMQQTANLRLSYHYSESFTDADSRQELLKLAQKASSDLQRIFQTQQEYIFRIENYDGSDWDRLYGQTGLWRKLRLDEQDTLWLKAQVDYYQALASEPAARTDILQGIIEKTRTGPDVFKGPAGQLIRAKAYVLMAHLSATYRQWAQNDLDAIMATPALPDRLNIEAMLLKLTLTGLQSEGQLITARQRLANADCRDDFDLNIRLAFLELKLTSPQSCTQLSHVIATWPDAESFVAGLILSDIAAGDQRDLQLRCPVAIELALQAALEAGPAKYSDLLRIICGTDGFQTPLAFWAAGKALHHSSPGEAIEYYLQAATAQERRKSPRLAVSSEDIALGAAELACELYRRDKDAADTALRAIGQYCLIAGSGADQSIQYIYAGLLAESNRTTQADQLLQTIADGAGRFANHAALDLIENRIRRYPDDADADPDIKGDLKRLIAAADKTDSDRTIAAAATALYCQILLKDRDPESAQQVIAILESTENMQDDSRILLKAGALRQLARFTEAAATLAQIADSQTPLAADEAAILLAEIVPQIDSYRQGADWPAFITDCAKLARLSLTGEREDYRSQAALISAEIAILAAPHTGDDLEKPTEILDTLGKQGHSGDIHYRRCMARLLAAKKDYPRATAAWAAICRAHTSQNAPDKPSWNWWRAKYYQILCWSRLPDTTEAGLVHAIEVLQNSYREIPPLWAQNLADLKIAATRWPHPGLKMPLYAASGLGR